MPSGKGPTKDSKKGSLPLVRPTDKTRHITRALIVCKKDQGVFGIGQWTLVDTKSWDRASFNQTSVGTILKETLEGWGAVANMSIPECIDAILN